MKLNTITIAVSAAVVLLPGCLNKDLSEAVSVRPVTDVTDVSISADFLAEEGDSTKTVRITSNRSFSAYLNDLDNPVPLGESVSWGSLEQNNFANLSNTTQTSDVKIIFRRNDEKIPKRGVLEIWSEGSKALTVNIKQDRIYYHLSLDAESLETSVEPEGGIITLNIESNATWKVEADPSSTAEVRFETDSTGIGRGSVKVRILENEDAAAKSAKFVISAEECENIEYKVSQPATKGDVKFFKALLSFRLDGVIDGTNSTFSPKVVVDTLNMDSEVFKSGVKFYYEYSPLGLDFVSTPTKKSAELTSDGFKFLPTALQKYTLAYVKVLATADGYRDTYTNAIIRHWRFGSKYITGAGESGVSFDSNVASGNSTCISFKGHEMYIDAVMSGTGRFFYLSHVSKKAGKTISGILKSNGTELGRWSIPLDVGTGTKDPGYHEEDIPEVKAGDRISFSLSSKSYNFFVWQSALLEQTRYKM